MQTRQVVVLLLLFVTLGGGRRSYFTLRGYFEGLTDEQLQGIEAW